MSPSPARRALGADVVETVRSRRRAVTVETTEPIPERVYTRRGYKPSRPGHRLYEATAESGITSVRACSTAAKYATSVADPAGATIRQRQGRIRSFFPTLEKAEEQAESLRALGLVVKIVEARPYCGPTARG